MGGMEIWFNPGCSKCVIAQEALDEAGLTYGVRRYLEQPPSSAELRDVLRRLDLEPWDICRVADATAAGITLPRERDAAHVDEWLEVMSRHPELVQRPIILTDDGTAYVARDASSLHRAIEAAQ
jgi:arsenate reductase